jgi:hypothetical protein
MSHTAWGLYAVWIGALFTAAAWLAARAAVLTGRPTRWIWVGASFATVALPLAVLAWPAATGRSPPGWTPVTDWPASPALLASQVVSSRPVLSSVKRGFEFHPGTAWLVLSLMALAWVVLSQRRLARSRRSWRRTLLGGREVEVSPDFGPAVVGVLRPAIVVPEWATTLKPAELELILRHETEHLSRHDSRLLAILVGCIVIMPWQPFLWLQLAGLRLAIEFDCDQRVLATAPRHRYADLLLSLAERCRWPGTAVTWGLPLVTLWRRPSQLESRLRAILRERLTALQRAGVLIALCLAVIATAAAWLTPPPGKNIPVAATASSTTTLSQPQDASTGPKLYWDLARVGGRPEGGGPKELVRKTGLYFGTQPPTILRRGDGC